MTLRRRLALLSALAVALAVLLASVLVYALVRDRLRGDVDNDLRHQADVVTQRAGQIGPLIAGSVQGPAPIPGGQGTEAVPQKGNPPPLPPDLRVGTKAKAKGKKGGKPPPEIGDRVFLQRAVPPPEPGG